jgi:hypothetical protein
MIANLVLLGGYISAAVPRLRDDGSKDCGELGTGKKVDQGDGEVAYVFAGAA